MYLGHMWNQYMTADNMLTENTNLSTLVKIVNRNMITVI